MTNEGLLKIGELAKAAGISVTTAKFYVKEGLIRPALKTGRNMSYYDPACVNTIGMIKTLQKDRFYPLSVIKRLMEGSPAGADMVFLDAIHKVDYQTSGERVSRAEAVKHTRLTAKQIDELAKEGLIFPKGSGRSLSYGSGDIAVMSLVRRRMEAGIPFEQSVRSFGIYERALRQAAAEDVDALTAVLPKAGFTAEAGIKMIRTSDETLEAFVSMRRKELNRRFGSERLEDLSRFEAALTDNLRRAESALEKADRRDMLKLLHAARTGSATGTAFDKTAVMYLAFARISGGDVAGSIAAVAEGREYFRSLAPSGEWAAMEWFLKVGWLYLAPYVLGCRQDAEASVEPAKKALAGEKELLGQMEQMMQ